MPRLGTASGSSPRTLVELGAGGGSLASHLKRHFRVTLTDLSPAMLAVSQAVNPECEHLHGDMRSLRLGREFDCVVDYAVLLRASDGTVTVVHDRHLEGIFTRAQWLQWFREAGIPARSSLDPWGRDVFVGIRQGA